MTEFWKNVIGFSFCYVLAGFVIGMFTAMTMYQRGWEDRPSISAGIVAGTLWPLTITALLVFGVLSLPALGWRLLKFVSAGFAEMPGELRRERQRRMAADIERMEKDLEEARRIAYSENKE